MCKETNLEHDDLEYMTIGMALDYIDEYIERKNPDRKNNSVRDASQNDFDKF